MKTIFAILLTLGLLATAGLAAPTVTQVSNAASFSLSPLQSSAIAQGAFFSVFGSGFGGAAASCGTGFVNCAWGAYPLPTTVANTSVSVTVNGTTVAPFISFAVNFGSYSQINAVLPSTTPTGPGTLTVTTSGTATAAFPITVAAATFGTFAINQAGTGPGVIFDAKSVILTPFHTAKPGDIVVLWGSGLGPAPDPTTEQTAPPAQVNLCATAANCPVVWVAGQKANVAYAGRSGYTAIDQIDFTVPPGVQGCYVQVAVQTGSVIGNFTSMAVDANGATCQDADGINYNDISSVVLSKGSANMLAFSMLSNYLNLNVPDLGNLQWDNDTISGQIGTFSAATLNAYQGLALAPSVGNCTVSPFLQYPPPNDPATSAVTFLDAGTSFSIAGPNGTVTLGKDVTQAGKTVGYGGASGGDPVGGETIASLITGCKASNGCPPFFLNTTGWGTSTGPTASPPAPIPTPATAARMWALSRAVSRFRQPTPRSSGLTRAA